MTEGEGVGADAWQPAMNDAVRLIMEGLVASIGGAATLRGLSGLVAPSGVFRPLGMEGRGLTAWPADLQSWFVPMSRRKRAALHPPPWQPCWYGRRRAWISLGLHLRGEASHFVVDDLVAERSLSWGSAMVERMREALHGAMAKDAAA